MPEFYQLDLASGTLVFNEDVEDLPEWTLSPKFSPEKAASDIRIECRLGDPQLLNCIVYKRKDIPGGIFSVFYERTPLFAAKAATNLVYAEALGHFAQMTANMRYGVDIFENMDGDNE